MSTRQIFATIAKYCSISASVGITSSIGAWAIWSRKCYFEPFTPATDQLFRHPLLASINPHSNPSIDDCCVRKVPLRDLKQDLVKDHRNGGSRLVTTFTQGMWGGYGFAIQRTLLNSLTERTKDNESDMWTKEELLSSQYSEGQIFCDLFEILSKTHDTIVTRGGDSPRSSTQNEPRKMDNIAELNVILNEATQEAEFRFKNIFFSGVGGPKDKAPLNSVLTFAHYQYCKLLVESGVSNCLK